MKMHMSRIYTLLLAPLSFAIASCNGGFFSASAPQENPHNFTVILYDRLALYGQEHTDPSQSGTDVPPTVAPLDVWDDDELVGVNWEHRILEYAASVQESHGDETSPVVFDVPFAIEWDGKKIVEGWLILPYAARVIDRPVLVYDPFNLCDKGRVLVRLYPNHYGDDLAPIAGLSQELNSQMTEYFSDRPTVCSEAP